MGIFSHLGMSISRRIRRKTQRRKMAPTTQGPYITVYRGTCLRRELQLWEETDGYVMSEAALDGYATHAFNGASFDNAWRAGVNDSSVALASAFSTWGDVGSYCLAHSEFGTELTRTFGPRPAISWTTDLATAERFAGGDGYVLTAKVPLTSILSAGTNAESEVLVANGVWATLYSSPVKR